MRAPPMPCHYNERQVLKFIYAQKSLGKRTTSCSTKGCKNPHIPCQCNLGENIHPAPKCDDYHDLEQNSMTLRPKISAFSRHKKDSHITLHKNCQPQVWHLNASERKEPIHLQKPAAFIRGELFF